MTPAYLHLQDWSGYSKTEVLIVSVTPKRYRITPVGNEPVKLSGRDRWLRPGQVALVPKTAVSFK